MCLRSLHEIFTRERLIRSRGYPCQISAENNSRQFYRFDKGRAGQNDRRRRNVYEVLAKCGVANAFDNETLTGSFAQSIYIYYDAVLRVTGF